MKPFTHITTRFVSIHFILCILLLIHIPAALNAQNTIPTATEVTTFPYTQTGIDFDMVGGNNPIPSGAGDCAFTDPSLVYKVTVPARGTLILDADGVAPLGGHSVGGIFVSTVATPTSSADLVQVDSLSCGIFQNGFMPSADVTAGEYYVLFTHQTPSINNRSIGIDFTLYTPPSDTLDVYICSNDPFISPAGNVLTLSGTYTDTLVGAAASGEDSLIFINLTFDARIHQQFVIQDETLNSTDTLRHTATTNLVSYAYFYSITDDWAEINGAVPALAGTNRSAFVWMRKSTQISGSSQMLISLNTASGGNVCLLQIGTNEELGVYDGGTAHYTGVVVTDGAWHHVGYTYDETTDSTLVYVDGVIHSRFKNSQTVSATNQLSLGQEFDSGNSLGNFYDGRMTEVSIWNEVLTEADVALLMEATIKPSHPKYANLQAYYPMLIPCLGYEDTLYDSSPHQNHGFTSSWIQSRWSATQLNGFDATDQFDAKWIYTPPQEGNTSSTVISTSKSLNETNFASGTYTLELTRDHIVIIDSWNLTVNVLPIELSYFEGYPSENGVKLLWQTASEQNNMGFELERGQGEAGSIVWENIGFVDGAGTTTEAQDYTFFDATPISGQSFYRIKQIDFDGSVSYSDRIEIQMDQVYKGIGEFYPNPTETGEVYIAYPHANEQDLRVSVKVFDLEGKLHIEQITYMNQGERTLALDLASLKTGMYLVKLTDRGQTNYRKLIIR